MRKALRSILFILIVLGFYVSFQSRAGGATNEFPLVSITSPTNNTVVQNAAGTLLILLTTSDVVGVVTNLDLFRGTNLIRNLVAAATNYIVIGSNVAAGAYALAAIANDNNGAIARAS